MREILQLLLIFYAFEGLVLALYIFLKKRKGEKIECPITPHCNEVIQSKYSRFLGVQVELLGMGYFAFVGLLYFYSLILPIFTGAGIVFLGFITNITAVFFSLYLLCLQAFVLKKGCSWCIVSAVLCGVILVTSLGASDFHFVALLTTHHNLVLFLHVLAVVLGFGTSMVADILFFKFLKDYRIPEMDSSVLHALSQVIWFALAILVTTGIGLYLPAIDELSISPVFLMKMVGVCVIIMNGALLNFVISPKLTHIFYEIGQKKSDPKLRNIRRLAFALGSVSMVSWYFTFFLGFRLQIVIGSDLGFWQLLIFYLFVLTCGIIGSQIVENIHYKKVFKE